MTIYQAPLRDIRFVLDELLVEERAEPLPGDEELTPDLVAAVLEEAGRFCEEVLHPLNQSGDEQGCTLDNGVVRTPEGFQDAYRQLAEGGWIGLPADAEDGGQGLPNTLATAVTEMESAANLAFTMYPSLSIGTYEAVRAHGSDALKQRYLRPLVEGRWSGTMCLTEPHCGTDLGMVRTKAVARDDGSYRVTGNKIFISAGDHDLTENIIHLVLARRKGAPDGVHGLSLFLVPKFLVSEDGTPGDRNGVTCTGIEHKMGIKAASTCALAFEDARGELVGEPERGMHAMFTMMNSARLAVGIQGLGLGEIAYQNAVAYARERLQGRALKGARNPDGPADPLLVHPDVRRMLLTMRAFTEGARALTLWVASYLDKAQRHPDAAQRQASDDLVALLTPVVKAFITDLGSEVTNLGVQVYGGHGYIRDNGMEQFVRDARIGQIYEGTNGIQAMDLVGRKLPAHVGRLLRPFFHPLAAYLEAHAGDAALAPLAKAFGRLQRATGWIGQRGLADPDEAGAAASDYLRLFGLVAMGYLWARMAEVAQAKVKGDEGLFYRAKIDTARFYFERLLPQSSALYAAIMAGSDGMMSFNDEAF